MRIMLGLFTALAVVPLFFFYAGAVGSAGTLAISSNTVCGISATTLPRTIYCTDIDESVATTPYLVYPNVSFDSVSAGTDFFCGLKSSRKVFYCWNGNPVNRKRVYRGSWVISDLTVGETQVSAIDRSGNEIRWWRKAGLFPSSVLGDYSSLTSGNNFTCAITTNGTMTCWGPLSNYTMSTIVAGDSHMCGLDSSGLVICQGSNSSAQCYAPTGSPYEYTGFALGLSHTCAIMQPNYTAVCWRNYGEAQLYQPLNGTAFEFLVAGGNLTCGLTTHTYSVLCWGSNWTDVSVRKLSLPMILPGICVAGGGDECDCGTYPESQRLCKGTGVICQRCDFRKPIPPSPPPALAPIPSKSKKTSMTGWKLDWWN
ncbi:Serine/threonine-protein kinase [Rhynchospora pubera]|uniref:non-specific serine/threonine protein kinase n=1 Tax=Rhynchospora pubera TaxID=906938 RepID=A0AAV8EMD2_9POAL|nr:Serine/threonine-protein kinase [Rhynchospora pubera]